LGITVLCPETLGKNEEEIDEMFRQKAELNMKEKLIS